MKITDWFPQVHPHRNSTTCVIITQLKISHIMFVRMIPLCFSHQDFSSSFNTQTIDDSDKLHGHRQQTNRSTSYLAQKCTLQVATLHSSIQTTSGYKKGDNKAHKSVSQEIEYMHICQGYWKCSNFRRRQRSNSSAALSPIFRHVTNIPLTSIPIISRNPTSQSTPPCLHRTDQQSETLYPEAKLQSYHPPHLYLHELVSDNIVRW
ncbi:unnamed protein product [Heterobilharzia americana]|nr:unnamed protein product [Heterobilharzia americana]